MALITDLNTEFITTALLHRMIEKGEEIPLIVAKTELEFVEDELNLLGKVGAIRPNTEEQSWEVTPKGEEIFDNLLDAYEALVDLDIFSGVNLSLDLGDELFDEDGHVLDDKLDPRFDEPVNEDEAEVFGTTDLRLAVVDFLAEKAATKAKKKFDAEQRHNVLSRVVFIQELGNDKYIDDKAFFDLKLGGITAEVNEIVSSVPPWLELAKEFDPPARLMEMIIDAGLRDAQKREMLSSEEECTWLNPAKQSKVMENLLKPLVS